MARRPSYDFERREREKAKAAKTAERVKVRTGNAEAPAPGSEHPAGTPPEVKHQDGVGEKS